MTTTASITPEARIEVLAYRFKDYLIAKPPYPPNFDSLDEIIRLAQELQDEMAEQRLDDLEEQALMDIRGGDLG
jgi:hypothetical protein